MAQVSPQGTGVDLKVSIVIPTMNEEESIGRVLDQIHEVMASSDMQYDVSIVDTNSKDRTREIAASKGAIVIDEPRRGYGRAYKTGFEKASGDVIATLDADCTYPAEDIPRLVKMLHEEKLEFITTNRLAHMEKGAMTLKHKVGNTVLNVTTRLLFRVKIKDSQSGMWIFRKEAYGKVDVTDDGMPFSEELKIEAFRKLRAKEVPITYRRRVGEVKLSSWEDGWKNEKFLWKKRFRGSRARS
ncbi:MAG TPA: glycosyltransferase family 2 protein [Methanomassiliicoccales archaeon]|nr:glycosyltransferase family 2 protein [Methanomassiliicoccales archaeon]